MSGSKSVITRKRARLDLEIAIDHYKREAGAEVAGAFVDEVRALFASLAAHPALGSPRYAWELDLPGLRAAQLSSYPYLVFYRVSRSAVEVVAVRHGARNPKSMPASTR